MSETQIRFVRKNWPIIEEALSTRVISASRSLSWIEATLLDPNQEDMYQQTLQQIRHRGLVDKMIRAMYMAIATQRAMTDAVSAHPRIPDSEKNKVCLRFDRVNALGRRMVHELQEDLLLE
jgi:hypothetical protein